MTINYNKSIKIQITIVSFNQLNIIEMINHIIL